MSSLIKLLMKRELIKAPQFVASSTQLEVVMGSVAYGVSSDLSDMDIYGFCIPPKEVVFPHLKGEINGFGRQKQGFEQYSQHHIQDLQDNKLYDITIYNIVKYFSLCMENNPNMIDSLFVPQRCILHSTPVGNYLRENRRKFLHKGCWHKFKGYAFSQVNKMKNKSLKKLVETCDKLSIDSELITSELLQVELVRRGDSTIQVSRRAICDTPIDNMVNKLNDSELLELYEIFRECSKDGGKLGKRLNLVKTYGYDIKFAYHVVRLLNEVEQILTEHDLDLERNREQLKSIRRGEWTIEEIENYFNTKERELESVYTNSKLPHSPNEYDIKQILLNCLEMYYGTLKNVIVRPIEVDNLINELQLVISKYSN